MALQQVVKKLSLSALLFAALIAVPPATTLHGWLTAANGGSLAARPGSRSLWIGTADWFAAALYPPLSSPLGDAGKPAPDLGAGDRATIEAINAATPFAARFGPIAPPFHFVGSSQQRERAVQCLASAMWYEAGNDARGQLAVGQVVLNRVRHRAFPKTVCGVVFQGSELRTGCQFTFTCDGALARVPPPQPYGAALSRAQAMLDGAVAAEVGLATHYHTNWVLPAWSPQMDKIAQVGTHLFFRWRGPYGQAAAMTGAANPNEPAVARLAFLAANAGDGPWPPQGQEPGSGPAAPVIQAAPDLLETAFVPPGSSAPYGQAPTVTIPGRFTVRLAAESSARSAMLDALDRCGSLDFCRVIGRIEGQGDAVAILYVRDRRTGVERSFWDCDRFPRRQQSQCLATEGQSWLGFEGNHQNASPATTR